MNKFLNLIFAVDEAWGFGSKGKMPWYNKEELANFKKITENNILIVGSKTHRLLPKLKNRKIFIATKNNYFEDVAYSYRNYNDIKSLDYIKKLAEHNNKKIFVIGGNQILNYFIRQRIDEIDTVYLSIVKGIYECDTFFSKKLLDMFFIEEHLKFNSFNFYKMKAEKFSEYQYIKVLRNCMENGKIRVGRNGETKSLFCSDVMKFDLRNGFPLLTTKKMFTRGIIEELLFFLKGQTDTKILEDKKVNIWKGNTCREFLDKNNFPERKEGIMGPMYFYQVRNFNAPYDEKTGEPKNKKQYFDQLNYVINTIKTQPCSRRIIMTVYNPAQVFKGVLFPCHSIVLHFYVDIEEKCLDMYCYNRSSDLFLGLPFNIASSSFLLEIIANVTNLRARYFYLGLGDYHIYENQYDSVLKVLNRFHYKFPYFFLHKNLETIEDIDNLEVSDFIISGYQSHKSIKVKMVS